MGLESLALMIVATIGPTTVIASNLLYLGTLAALYGGIAYGTQLLGSLFIQKPSVPKAEDGSYNLKQNVPSLPIVYGRVKKGGDYLFLEEKDGTAYHIIVWCGRRIQGFVTHYLHDETTTLDVDGQVTAPSHFYINGRYVVKILTRNGLDAETAYSDIVTAFSPDWTDDHRGDGLATVRMSCGPVGQGKFLEVYPNQMPEHSAVGDGALLYDPRKDSTQPGGAGSHRHSNPNSWEFSKNLALMRLDYLCKPYGGKMAYPRMYMPDWMHAADICDQDVTNRVGGTEKRYHGGLWLRANNDPIEVGRIMDEAAEMIVYERADGKIGVHAGEYVAPDITLTEDEIVAIKVDKNRRQSSTVLAVRGRFTNTANHYNVEDAAIYGDPYGEVDDSTERTRTFNNSAVQSHNHCQRKQKLTYTRANARKVQITADYSAAKNCAYRRFIRVHYPSRGLNNAVIEITSTVSVDLRNMIVTFAGIVVPETLFDFDAATEEGVPGETVSPIIGGGVPEPTDFVATIETEVVAGGATAAYILGTWTVVNDALVYEMEYERTDLAAAPVSVLSDEGDDNIRSGYLADGEEYRVRLRAWGGGTPGPWTNYTTLIAAADPIAPAALTSFTQTASAPHLGSAAFAIVTPNDAHIKTVKLYRKSSGAALDIGVDNPFVTLNVAPSASYGHIHGDATRTNLLSNGDFASDTVWTKGAGWTIAAGKATHVGPTASSLSQSQSPVTGDFYRLQFTVSGRTVNSVQPRFAGGTTATGVSRSANGTFSDRIQAATGNTLFAFLGGTTFDGSVDDAVLYQETASCVPQGDWDYYAVPFNVSNIAGPPSGPVAVTIV